MDGKKSEKIILLSHGGGGRLTQQLIRDVIVKYFDNPILRQMDDGAVLDLPRNEIVFTTDSYVVNPLQFPGGDIGKLAACGTINDVVMQGAKPLYLSLGLILEEGYPVAELEKIMFSMAAVLKTTDVTLVTGDTKVVERGHGNGVFINTSGIGIRRLKENPHCSQAVPGDAVILTGSMGDHGIAIMSQREGLTLQSSLESDVAPLWDLLEPVFESLPKVHVLRDPTRGGVAAALCDIAQASEVGIRIEENKLPIKKEVQGVCDLLGLDPLYMANEGKALLLCPAEDACLCIEKLRAHPQGRAACRIGTVLSDPRGTVLLHTKLGGERVIDMPMGELLPRIC
ncbi:hydrogenase expression/formation protein HypE [bacterium]|nr:hydrogenase expression/formation protein HypE [bacterium]